MSWIALPACTALVMSIACSSSSEPTASNFATTYHLRSVDGVALPITDAITGELLDSGEVLRLGGDTVVVQTYSHLPPAGGAPGIGTIRRGIWLASETGSIVVFHPLIASSLDTAFLGHGDTLTLHAHANGSLHVDVFVTP